MPATAKNVRDKKEQMEYQTALTMSEEFVRTATPQEWQDYLYALVAGVEYPRVKQLFSNNKRKQYRNGGPSTIEPPIKKMKGARPKADARDDQSKKSLTNAESVSRRVSVR